MKSLPPLEPKEPILEYVTTSAPLRISFVGGGTDLPAFYERDVGAVLSSAIDKNIYVTVKRMGSLFDAKYRLNYSITENVDSLDDMENHIARECLRLVPVCPPLYIGTVADVPASSGLGSSSCFAVALLKLCPLPRLCGATPSVSLPHDRLFQPGSLLGFSVSVERIDCATV